MNRARRFKSIAYLLVVGIACGNSRAFCLEGSLPSFWPDHLISRTGGNLGMVGIGGEYVAAKKMIAMSAVYGFTPAAFSGATVHSLALKGEFFPFPPLFFEGVALSPFLSGGLVGALNGPFHLTTVSVEPVGYYSKNRILELVGAGLLWELNSVPMAMFLEVSLLGTDLEASVKLKQVPWSVWSVSVGLKFNTFYLWGGL